MMILVHQDCHKLKDKPLFKSVVLSVFTGCLGSWARLWNNHLHYFV